MNMNESADVHRDLMTSWKDAPTRTLFAGGVEFAYRQLGPGTGVPVVFLTHLAAVLDNWDPRVVDGIAAEHRVITFDNRGVGASSGSTPTTIEEMASDAVTFIRALGFDQVSNRRIAQDLFISEKTVSVHISHILAKLGVTNRTEAAAAARRINITP
jgi:Bacterial regulatory proteins, luxR family/alpha/beta hydrolase fold